MNIRGCCALSGGIYRKIIFGCIKGISRGCCNFFYIIRTVGIEDICKITACRFRSGRDYKSNSLKFGIRTVEESVYCIVCGGICVSVFGFAEINLNFNAYIYGLEGVRIQICYPLGALRRGYFYYAPRQMLVFREADIVAAVFNPVR